jgi:hypothetical protein
MALYAIYCINSEALRQATLGALSDKAPQPQAASIKEGSGSSSGVKRKFVGEQVYRLPMLSVIDDYRVGTLPDYRIAGAIDEQSQASHTDGCT